MATSEAHVQRMSKMGLALLAEYEGLRLVSYLDSAGLPTIGVGHLITDYDRQAWQHLRNRKGAYVISEAKAMELLGEDVAKVERACRAVNPGPYENPNVFDSMCSFLFNVGAGVAAKPWARWVLIHEDVEKAEHHFPRWIHAGDKRIKGLVLRRQNELAWMRKGMGASTR